MVMLLAGDTVDSVGFCNLDNWGPVGCCFNACPLLCFIVGRPPPVNVIGLRLVIPRGSGYFPCAAALSLALLDAH